MRRVRNVLAVLAVLGFGIGIGACTEIPTAAGEGDDPPTCWWVDGVLYCEGQT